MLSYMSHTSDIMIAAAIFVVLLVIVWSAIMFPARRLAILTVGLLVLAAGIGTLFYQQSMKSDRMPASAYRPDAEIKLKSVEKSPRAQRQRNENLLDGLATRQVETGPASGQTETAAADPESAAEGASAPQEEQQWQIVPVFYGTDRKREDGGERIAYGTERGKRLEVGRALVTVPKNHQVPNIERPWVYKIPLLNIVIMEEEEDPAKHFTMKELKHLTPEEFASLAREQIGKSKSFKDQALVFVDGFYTTFDYAVYRAAQISYDLDFDGGSFVYSWPSRGELGPIAYSADREAAEQASRYLEEFLTLIAKKSGAQSMTIVAHSMGNKLLLPVLQKFKLRKDTDIKISQVILAAPDVDRDTFAGLAREIEGLSKGGITLYAASNDLALNASRQFWGGVARAGDVPEDGPIIVSGVDTIDVTGTNTDIFSINHAGYAQSQVLLKDIRSLMSEGYRPPHLRNGKLRQRSVAAGNYWQYR